MLAGVPTVVSDVGGLNEIVDHGVNGMKSYAGNPNSIADSVLALLYDKQLASNVAKQAKIKVKENFNWTKIAQDTHYTYEKAICKTVAERQKEQITQENAKKASKAKNNETEITKTYLTTEKFIELTNNISDGTLTSKNLKEILDTIMESDKTIKEIIKEAGIKNITDDSAIKEMISKVISENPDSVADYKAGKDRAIKYLMGQVMKESKGTLNPKMAMDILIEELNK